MVGFSIDAACSDEQVEFLMRDPYCAVGTDGLPGEHPDPRLYGTFPRLLGRFVREKKVLSLTDAVKRMSALPADILHLEKRGRLKEGCYADIAIFDFNVISDTGSYDNPRQFPLGVKHVIVNGSPVVENGKHTGCLPGKTIKYSC